MSQFAKTELEMFSRAEPLYNFSRPQIAKKNMSLNEVILVTRHFTRILSIPANSFPLNHFYIHFHVLIV